MTKKLFVPQAITLAILGGLLLPSLPALAEGGAKDGVACKRGAHNSAEWKQKRHEKMQAAMDKLNLSEEQKTRLKAAHEGYKNENSGKMEAMKARHQKLRELKQSGNEAEAEKLRADMKQDFAAMRARHEATMKNVLSPEQYSQWQAMQAAHRQKWEERRKQGESRRNTRNNG